MARLLLCLSWLLAIYQAFLALRACAAPGRGRMLARAFRSRFARDSLRLLGIALRVEGSPPPSPALLVANHLSWIDALVILAAAAPAPVTLERALPGYSALARSIGCVVVRRSSIAGLAAVVAGVEGALRRGEYATFHPEATTGFGGELKSFHPAIFQAAVGAGAPVACALIAYRVPEPQASPERSIHWVDWTPFLVHAWRAIGLRGVEARLRFGAALPPPSSRKEASARARQEIERLAREFPPAPLSAPASGP
jgi:1-acyl-sn-glycerol-3-phosphate acyltransferase